MSAAEKYDALWEGARRALEDGSLRADTPPVDGAPRWGLSLVLLPPPHVSERVAGVAADLGSVYVGSHHVYGAADLHLTISSLEPYRDEVDPATIEHYVDAIERSLELLDVHVRLRGLGGSAAGAFVQGFDGDTLGPIRRRMQDSAAGLHDGVAPPMAFVRDTAHVSISVHRDAVPEPFAAEYLHAHRTSPYGEMTGAVSALVRYRSSGLGMAMEVLHAFQ